MRLKFANQQSAEVSPVDAYVRAIEAIRTMDQLPGIGIRRVASTWPKEFAFHAEAIKWAVFAGEAKKNKAYKRLRARDFEDIHLEFDEDDDAPERKPPSRSAIADAELAGGWWAALALLPYNVAEFNIASDLYRRGKRKQPLVDDQRIVVMVARGKTLKTIGENLYGGKLNDEQVEGRIREIAIALANIANGRSVPHRAGYGSPRQTSAQGYRVARR